MSSTYGDILSALVTHLAPSEDRDPASPFRQVRRGTSGKSLAYFVEQLERHGDANQSPAALVRYGGGDSNEGFAGHVEEKAMVQVACLVTGVDAIQAEEKLFAAVDFVRGEIHNRAITGIINPLMWAGNVELSPAIAIPQSVAAMVVRFTAPCFYAEE